MAVIVIAQLLEPSKASIDINPLGFIYPLIVTRVLRPSVAIF